MYNKSLGSLGLRRSLIAAAIFTAGAVSTAHATVTAFVANLDGASESPPNLSPGTGLAQVELDAAAHTLHLYVSFEGLVGATTAAHIHAATVVPGEGAAGVATTTPTFPGFPVGVTSGTYEITLDLTDPTSFNASFITAHGGTTAGAEAFLSASIANGTAYLNIHTVQFGGGEIRGFFTEGGVPTAETTWGGVKSLFR